MSAASKEFITLTCLHPKCPVKRMFCKRPGEPDPSYVCWKHRRAYDRFSLFPPGWSLRLDTPKTLPIEVIPSRPVILWREVFVLPTIYVVLSVSWRIKSSFTKSADPPLPLYVLCRPDWFVRALLICMMLQSCRILRSRSDSPSRTIVWRGTLRPSTSLSMRNGSLPSTITFKYRSLSYLSYSIVIEERGTEGEH